MTTRSVRPAPRLAFFYAAFFTVVGIQLPFWPVWLAAKGMSPAEIGVLLALGVGAKIAGNPLAGHLADRLGERRRPMVAFAGCGLAAFALFGLVDGFWPIFVVSLLFFTLWPPIMPLGESLTMLAARGGALDYGRVRLWGSISFVVLAVVAGRVLVDQPAGTIFWMVLAAIALTTLACQLLPDIRPERASSMALSILQPLRDRSFALFLAAAALIQGSHAVYYAFGTLHWRAAGYSEDVIGALWAEGVVAEILLFIVGGRVLRRLGPARLLALGGLAGGVRWLVLGLTDSLPALVCVQTLHAFTFGAAHLGAIHFIAKAVPPAFSATAQSLYSSLVMGLGLGLMLLASGPLYAALAGAAYLPMAAAALIGGVLAWVLARRR
jgi:MFS transporter, PPP family, 3-phenylpropionic acid transporter